MSDLYPQTVVSFGAPNVLLQTELHNLLVCRIIQAVKIYHPLLISCSSNLLVNIDLFVVLIFFGMLIEKKNFFHQMMGEESTYKLPLLANFEHQKSF